ncbi:cytochrome C oxidase subunit II [Rhodopirellula maiorica SM1]|uniref:Cytochrome aa3 subunit 2 n=2 Tax=Novipirellula TaxID=2795426 RepID=M5RDG3_9BACT|nr:cytochrome C oxidase subunit II [Rhodopirellula maiorica SM1]
MSGGAVAIWLIVIGLAVYAIYQPGEHHPRTTKLLVIGGGAVFPTIVLTGLLCFSLPMLPDLHRPAPSGSLQIHVSGVLWWWRVDYIGPDGEKIATANEIRLPVDQPVEFKLDSEDVIHSFWIPSLGGKVDMIPGRQTRLQLHPTRVGTYRGACAEFCGKAHAQMNFDVVVMPVDEFDDWLARQSEPAKQPIEPDAIAGQQVFFKYGCSACHAVRGTDAKGKVGPDLTHFGSRLSIAASVLKNNPENLARWITQTHDVKPGAEMPQFDSLPDDDLQAMVAYLEQLK